jgi:hypothetical protein
VATAEENGLNFRRRIRTSRLRQPASAEQSRFMSNSHLRARVRNLAAQITQSAFNGNLVAHGCELSPQ